MKVPLQHTPRILSLDGGGVRGLSSLVLLRGIMDELGEVINVKNPRPCDHFDLICGTSTGGLIAIMLGRLGMVSH
jgi:patatin-like phospholipase/acyl hydrolase